MCTICFNQGKFSELFLTSESHVWVQSSSSPFLPYFPSFFPLIIPHKIRPLKFFKYRHVEGRERQLPLHALPPLKKTFLKSGRGGEREGQMEKDRESLTILSALGTFL